MANTRGTKRQVKRSVSKVEAENRERRKLRAKLRRAKARKLRKAESVTPTSRRSRRRNDGAYGDRRRTRTPRLSPARKSKRISRTSLDVRLRNRVVVVAKRYVASGKVKTSGPVAEGTRGLLLQRTRTNQLPVRTFHGIPLTSYDGSVPYSNGHIRELHWQPFPKDYLEQAYETIGSWPFMHDTGIKDPKSIHRTESLTSYSDEPVLNVRQRLS